ncbi:phosphoethanolamine N-methyltransferase [Dongia mobilis]|uniref:Phosphoethanolamine N-methyltransferase n=1 Tax=Dongia mobilis TaxID=578943 RepID=A0A4R6WPG8_9PROT|nr:methyltransferase domain-containing protein [Dongia mobilis]TDQ80945.1 phosphoethanolamine N-methyltransferase [Dongia mobilis]
MSDNATEEYDGRMLTLLQMVWGEGFLSPGGPQAVREIMSGVALEGKRVLDIGCGLGGLDQVLLTLGAAHVTGLDVAGLIVEMGQERIRRAGLANRIEIKLVEPGPLPFADNSFDIVFGKDAWLHIPDKAAHFAEIHRVLKPGGRIAAGDWMKSPGPYSRDMEYFFEMEGLTYHLVTLAEYGTLLHAAGFVDVKLEDITEIYRREAQDELARMKGELAPVMLAELGEAGNAHFLEDWRSLTVVLDKGELRPARIWATKPA